jgi:hypothetical protein
MALRLALRRPAASFQSRPCTLNSRNYATVRPLTIAGKPPGPPEGGVPLTVAAPSALDALILSELRRTSTTSLPVLVQQFEDHSGKVLDASLPYESRPSAERKVKFDGNKQGVVMVAHAVQDEDRYKVSMCSGFPLNVSHGEAGEQSQCAVLTCTHTLQEVTYPQAW